MNLLNYKVKNKNNELVSLENYKNKVVLIVNSATECGFTPQYSLLEELYKKYKNSSFEILDFPCNQFGNQAPGSQEEIHQFCTTRFGVTFPQFAKIEVNGDNADPLFKDLVKNTKFEGFDKNHKITPILENLLSKADKDYSKKSSIKWNFTKFLFDKEGNLIKRFEPTYDLKLIDKDIETLLKA